MRLPALLALLLWQPLALANGAQPGCGAPGARKTRTSPETMELTTFEYRRLAWLVFWRCWIWIWGSMSGPSTGASARASLRN